MSNWHKLFYYLQFTVLSIFILYFFIPEMQIGSVFKILFILIYSTEIGILECQRRMNQNLIYYRKSGFFALLDLLSVTFFLGYSAVFVFDFFFIKEETSYRSLPFISLLSYTLIRKLYIFKNYTY